MSSPVIQLWDIRYRYHDGTEALRGVSLTIRQGERVCLAGPNGAGKSTLMLCLAGLLKTPGVAVNNNASLPDPSVFGLVFQDPEDQLFCPTVGEDVAFGPRNLKLPENDVAARVEESLAAVGLSGFEARSAHHLSGGEKKRAAIASVLACRPSILALDEPWSNLDARAAQAVTSFLCSYQGTLIVVSQDLYHAADVCERFIVIDDGVVVADGAAQEILGDTNLLETHGLAFGARCRVCRR